MQHPTMDGVHCNDENAQLRQVVPIEQIKLVKTGRTLRHLSAGEIPRRRGWPIAETATRTSSILDEG